ncbi:MerR family transcriptional regulator [Neobacillus sp. WH10]|uniref:MerR family transcriptional regulator n=1 Tax=Neobacillus sp. WH10 TaxID=3047873 RepID=UPI0024C19EF1|nr:MerR family transcriptional regulator [Neobacillus sp. WH10]WHY79051.1 MerR family transcriptional regulator [Neobacillus sp. WH10]
MKKYKIGEVRSEFGVSLDALRFYEKKGFLKPQKDNETGFRYYTYEDFGVFLSIKNYRQMGFQVKEIGSIFNGLELEDIISRCNNKIAEKNEAIKMLELETKLISEYVSLLKEFNIEDRQWFIETVETYYLLKHVHIDKGDLCENPLLKKWLNFLPIVHQSLLILKDQYQSNNINESYWVMAIPESKMEEYQLPFDDSVLKIDMGECLNYLYKKDVNDPFSTLILNEPLEIIHKLGYTLNGDVLCRYVCETKHQDKTIENYVIMFPIIKSDD